MIRVIRQSDMTAGRWLNGMGVSWDIAAEPPGAPATDFGWRFAIARIDADVPFSHYEGVDRVFTLIEGRGLTLAVAGVGGLAVGSLFAPLRFPGDAATSCRLAEGPCRALNLFLDRRRWSADVAIATGRFSVDSAAPALLFALDGPVSSDAGRLEPGDAAIVTGTAAFDAGSSRCYVAKLRPQ